MKVILKTLPIIFIFNFTFAGWQGAKMLRVPDDSIRYMSGPAFATDNYGYPWAIWERWWYSHVDLFSEFSKWNGSTWEDPTRIPDSICFADWSTIFDFVFDHNNKLFLIYHHHDEQNHCDIYSARYDPILREWELPKQVNDPDTTILDDFQPRIAIGGGEIWANWFNENGDSVICNIKASHWNSNIMDWESEMTVNPDSGGINRMDWFSNIAVDTNGIPHIVWVQLTPAVDRIRYSKYENGRWIEPIFITNPDSLIPTGPYGAVNPKIVVDNQNVLHSVFPAYSPPNGLVRVYYTENSGSGWENPIAFDTFSSPGDPVCACDIAVDSPDNIWVTWGRWYGKQIFASHFDGIRWSPEERIDDGRSSGFGNIALDGHGNPFVGWSAVDTISQKEAIWYNRYVSSAIEEDKEKLSNFRFISSFNRIEIKYFLPHKDHIKVKVYDINGRMVGNLLD